MFLSRQFWIVQCQFITDHGTLFVNIYTSEKKKKWLIKWFGLMSIGRKRKWIFTAIIFWFTRFFFHLSLSHKYSSQFQIRSGPYKGADSMILRIIKKHVKRIDFLVMFTRKISIFSRNPSCDLLFCLCAWTIFFPHSLHSLSLFSLCLKSNLNLVIEYTWRRYV